MFSQSVNQPNYVQHFKSFLISEIGEENLSVGVDEYIKKYLDTEARDPNRLHDMYLSAYVNKAEYTTIATLTNDFYALKQYILHAPIGAQFITSDNPGFTIVGDKILSLGGFGDTYTFVFPISPSACLYLKSTDKEDKSNLEKLIYPLIIKNEEVEEINGFTKQISTKDIFVLNNLILEKT